MNIMYQSYLGCLARCTLIFFADLLDFKDDHGDGAEPTALESKINAA